MFFDKYQSKKDGVIRGYDIRSGKVKVLAGVIMIICMIMVVICLFPAVWVFLASFKDIKEFTRNVTIIPEKFDWSRMEETWNAFKFTKYYMNSMISVLGCTICAVVFNGLLAYGLSVLKPKGYQIINGLVMWSLLIPGTVSIVAGLLQSGGCEDHIRTGGWRNLLPDSVASAGDTGCCIHCGQSLWKAEGISEICGDNGRTDPVYAVRKPDLPQSLFSKSRECLSCTPECSGYL